MLLIRFLSLFQVFITCKVNLFKHPTPTSGQVRMGKQTLKNNLSYNVVSVSCHGVNRSINLNRLYLIRYLKKSLEYL